MATKKLKLKTETDMFGTDVALASSDGSISFAVGSKIGFDPTKKLSKKLDTGYLFRSPNLDPDSLNDLWDTVENFIGEAAFTAEIDTKSEVVTAHMRIAEKSDATMFAFAHNTFEKWSDEKEAEAREQAKVKQKAVDGKLNADGTVTVTMEVTTLGD